MTPPRQRKPCDVDGCTSVVHVHGLCQSHVRRLREYGDPCGGPDPRHVIYLRRLVGLPPEGPSAEQRSRGAEW